MLKVTYTNGRYKASNGNVVTFAGTMLKAIQLLINGIIKTPIK